MKKRFSGFAEPFLTFLTVVILGLPFLMPQDRITKLLFAGTCMAFPEGRMTERETEKTTQSSPEAVQTQKNIPASPTATPQDILDKIAQAKKTADSDKKDGDIREMTYGKPSSTEFFENILIRNVTEDVKPDYKKQWEQPLSLKVDREKPAVLIFHTHTTEGYETLDRDFYAADVSSRTNDTDFNVARVGTAISEELTKAGFRVIHDKTIHDTKYNGAYDRSRATVQKYLDENPDISVVLDVHRDAIQENNGTKIKPVTTIDGKKSAQIMIIAGAEGGNAKQFPDWEQNLRFAMHLQDKCESMYKTLMRPIFFCHRKYNMDMTPCSLLVEFGSEANTLEEAEYAGRLFGRSLAKLLEEYEE